MTLELVIPKRNVKPKFLAAIGSITLSAITLSALVGCGGQKFAVEEENSSFGQVATWNTEVDVLWVVDTSSSMAKHQDRLASQVGLFIDGLNRTGLDYRIAVTSMDMSGSGLRGRFYAQAGTPKILTANTPNLVSVLAGRLRLGESGSPVERGREAMQAALSSPLASSDNAGFLRANALLNVIYLSDEEDQSPSIDYATWLDSIKPPLPLGGRNWLAHFMGVMPSDPNCFTSEWGFSSVGYGYLNLVDASGGSKESICDGNLQRALTNVRARILEVITEFALDRKPNIASIKVYVDGQLVAQDATNGWTYRESTNSIRFHGSAIPGVGARIHVQFDPEGLK
ncbi:MAG TPA: hypothetical protein PLZ57_04315 [Pseudobdellovibrionaceae bacterium]|nr:hypothetical protein [Pseudobdellovibrionaceae bacterium]